MNLVAVILICGMALPVPLCNRDNAIMFSERTAFDPLWCASSAARAGQMSAQVNSSGTYEVVTCELREPLPATEDIATIDAETIPSWGGPR